MSATGVRRDAVPNISPHSITSDLSARRFTALDAAFLGVLALMVACHIAAALLARGWVTAAATDVLVACCLLAMATRPAWRPLLLRLFVLGLVAGVLELFTDASGEHVAHSLVYPTGEPMLWDSPLYMPLSWAVVLTQLGYLGWRLRGLVPPLRLWQAAALAGLAGAATVPFYEEMAYYAGWWRYTPVLHVGHTPIYVLLFEGGTAALLPLITGRLLARPVRHAALLGIVVGVWMPVVALLSWLAVGR
ncbi:MAG TPA: hypothetical protein VF510_25980 [Ktedonobacterales bacterium]